MHRLFPSESVCRRVFSLRRLLNVLQAGHQKKDHDVPQTTELVNARLIERSSLIAAILQVEFVQALPVCTSQSYSIGLTIVHVSTS